MYGFEFNNKYSKDLGIYVGKRPPIPKAEKVINHIEVPGKSGTLTEDTGVYKNTELTFECTIKEDNVKEKTILLNNWLDGSGILKLDYLTDFFFKVKEVKFEGTDIDYITGDFTVTFVCDPYKYYIDNSIIEIKNPTIIYGPEFSCKSEPIIKIYAQGDLNINIGKYSIKLLNVQDYITVDSTIQECYKENSNCNNHMYGNFPLLVKENKINWEGNISKIELISNWRCL